MNPTKSTDIAEFVREIRRSLNCTQEELAAQLGVTFSTVNRWENSKSYPSKLAVRLLKSTAKDMDNGDRLIQKYFPS